MRAHHTKNKGDLGVIAAHLDLVERGFDVLIPRTEHAPFDLVAYDAETQRFFRVQVKYRTPKDGTLRLRFSTSWADRNGTHTVAMRKDQVDVLCVYCPATRLCYYLDPKNFRASLQLRVTATGWKQTSTAVFIADDFRAFPPNAAPHAQQERRTRTEG